MIIGEFKSESLKIGNNNLITKRMLLNFGHSKKIENVIYQEKRLIDRKMWKMRDIENIEFSKAKFKQVLHYISGRCGHLENVGKTVLFKILYFVDFDYYELNEAKLTGESYKKSDYGPAPIHFEEMIKELEEEEKIKQFTTMRGGHEQQKFISLEEPNIDLISGKELKVIEDAINKYSCMSATQISALSHRDIPYKATKDNEIINYEKVFYRDPLFSVREYEEDD